MPDLENTAIPTPKKDWFDRLPVPTRALLLALLMFAVSAITFVMGIHGWRAGEPLVNMAGRSDWSDSLLVSAGTFALGAVLSAVGLGWIKFPKPEGSGAELPKS